MGDKHRKDLVEEIMYATQNFQKEAEFQHEAFKKHRNQALLELNLRFCEKEFFEVKDPLNETLQMLQTEIYKLIIETRETIQETVEALRLEMVSLLSELYVGKPDLKHYSQECETLTLNSKDLEGKAINKPKQKEKSPLFTRAGD